MATDNRSREELLAEIENLRYRLGEAEEILHAIQSGAVDALVVSRPEGERIFTLQGADYSYRVLVETMNEGAAILSPDGVILYCNNRLAAMLQIPLEKCIGTRLISHVAPMDQALFTARLGTCALACDTEEIALITAGENNLPVLFSCCALELSGAPGIGVVLTDISYQKQAEARKALNEELERRVAERTAELREKDQLLVVQGRQAAMGEMIGSIAHQWRQPLNSLGLAIQQLLLFYDSGDFDRTFLEKNVRTLMGLVKHMSTTIDDFRNYFKPDNEKAEFTLSDTIAKTLALVEDSFNNKQIEIKVEVKDDPIIYGYRNEFAQALLNILNNARDVLTEREVTDPTVTITVCSEAGRAVVTIADNAGGIPEEIMDKVFNPYFTTKGPQEGTGVGLYMSKAIIEKHMGGKLSARNTTRGAEFRIEV